MMLLLPELIVCGLILFLLCLTLADKRAAGSACTAVGLAALAALGASVWSFSQESAGFFQGTYRIDLLSQAFKAVICLAFFLVALISKDAPAVPENRRVEFFLFMASATLGMLMMPSSMDLLTLYLSLELSSYSLYLLSAMRRDARVGEAAVKYLLFGAATSGLMLWGFGILAGLAGTTRLADIAGASGTLYSQPAFALALMLVSFAFLFKLSAFPLHFWAPDTYESAPTQATAFIATASKAAAVSVFVRMFLMAGIGPGFAWVLGVFSFLSMALGNAVALVQKDVKRLLAYSSVAQAGYLVLGLLSNSTNGYASSLFYAFAYVLMNAAAFLVVATVARDVRHDNPQIAHFNGLAERSPLLALILLLSLLSLAGIPPLAGFTGKWILFSAAMDEGHWFLVLWGVLNSVVSLFYYLTLVKHAYLEKPAVAAPMNVSVAHKALAVGFFAALVCLGVFPNFFITLAQQAVSSGLVP